MNKSKMDNLFREKLHHHQVAPRPEAWTKLKGNLDSDRRKGWLVYWRVAAIVILLSASLFLVYKMMESRPGATTADTNIDAGLQVVDKNKEQPVEPGHQIIQKTDILSEKAQEKQIPPEEPPRKTDIRNLQPGRDLAVTTQTLEKKVPETFADGEKAISIEVVEPIESKTLQPNKPTGKALTAVMDKQLESNENDLPKVTITFKKGEEQIANTEMVENEELSKVGKFALKKVINLARDIKEGEVGISTLRQKKDELMAFDFKKKKNVKDSK